jgi:hypothetical protein
VDSKKLEPDQEFLDLSQQTFERASRPYVIGGEDDTRLIVHARSLLSRMGDDRFSEMVLGLEPSRRDALRILFEKTYLKQESFEKTINAIEGGKRKKWPAEIAARKAWPNGEFHGDSGW